MLFINQIPKTTQTWPQGRQSHLTDAHIYVTRLPRRHKVTQLNIRWVPRGSQEATQDTQEAAKWPNWGLDGSHLAPGGAPERPQKTSKTSPNDAWKTPWKKLCKIALFSWGNRVFQPKNLKNTSFLLSRGRWFLVFFFFWKSKKTIMFYAFLPSRIAPKHPEPGLAMERKAHT